MKNEFIDKVKALEAEAAFRVGLKGVAPKIVFLPSWIAHMASDTAADLNFKTSEVNAK